MVNHGLNAFDAVETWPELVEEMVYMAMGHYEPMPHPRKRAGWHEYLVTRRAVEAWCNYRLASREYISECVEAESAAWGAILDADERRRRTA